MILAHEQDITERYFFFSEGSNGAGKNEFISQFTCLQLHFYIMKVENIVNNEKLMRSSHSNKH